MPSAVYCHEGEVRVWPVGREGRVTVSCTCHVPSVWQVCWSRPSVWLWSSRCQPSSASWAWFWSPSHRAWPAWPSAQVRIPALLLRFCPVCQRLELALPCAVVFGNIAWSVHMTNCSVHKMAITRNIERHNCNPSHRKFVNCCVVSLIYGTRKSPESNAEMYDISHGGLWKAKCLLSSPIILTLKYCCWTYGQACSLYFTYPYYELQTYRFPIYFLSHIFAHIVDAYRICAYRNASRISYQSACIRVLVNCHRPVCSLTASVFTGSFKVTFVICCHMSFIARRSSVGSRRHRSAVHRPDMGAGGILWQHHGISGAPHSDSNDAKCKLAEMNSEAVFQDKIAQWPISPKINRRLRSFFGRKNWRWHSTW